MARVEGKSTSLKARKHKAIWLRLGGAAALLGYLVLLFNAYVHVGLETHEHAEAVHAAHHEAEPDHDHQHSPHPATDHNPDVSTPALGKAEQLLAHDSVTAVALIVAPVEEAEPGFSRVKDKPKHPPPRLPEQPRSPPVA
jgi:hypothetical protein